MLREQIVEDVIKRIAPTIEVDMFQSVEDALAKLREQVYSIFEAANYFELRDSLDSIMEDVERTIRHYEAEKSGGMLVGMPPFPLPIAIRLKRTLGKALGTTR